MRLGHGYVSAMVIAACYQPRDLACQTACDQPGATDGACPSGMTCGEDLLCFPTDHVPCAQRMDAGGGPRCARGGLLDGRCFVGVGPELVLSGMVDTGVDPRCEVAVQVGGPALCVLAADDITVNATTVTGTRPLVILAGATIIINGPLDASSHLNSPVGPGADDMQCTAPGIGARGDMGAGGGAGGSFHDRGGNGGLGGTGANGGSAPPATAVVTSIRGGCPGGPGGGNVAGTLFGGNGGSSGGALYLTAGSSITVSGIVNASGAGGVHGGATLGGGGGGSGGFIGLTAPQIDDATGVVVASGGSGASGGGNTEDGSDGADPVPTDINPAIGGVCNTCTGGFGGNGATVSSLPSGGGAAGSTGGGGGGGGATGHIVKTLTAASR